MPGVLRPYTLVDVLAAINDQSGSQQTDATALTAPLSQVAEADEQVAATDSAFAAAQTPPGWDQGVWGAASWQ